MGMFDSYEPNGTLNCPNCGASLSGWQGKDGQNELLLWRQGHASPVGLLPVEGELIEFTQTEQKDDTYRLPDRFNFYTLCESCDSRVTATGKCSNGTWSSSEIVCAEKRTRQ